MARQSITIFMNGDTSKECTISVYPHTTLKDMLGQTMDAFNLPHSTRCKLMLPSGDSVTEDDIEFLDSNEPLFLSKGEKLAKGSNFALYEEVRALGEGGFG